MSPAPIILRFRRDLRLEDCRPFRSVEGGSPILPVYIHETEPSRPATFSGGHQAFKLRGTIAGPAADCSPGDPVEVLAKLIAETGEGGLCQSRIRSLHRCRPHHARFSG